MCNLYNIKATRAEFNAYFSSTDDWRHELAVEKDSDGGRVRLPARGATRESESLAAEYSSPNTRCDESNAFGQE